MNENITNKTSNIYIRQAFENDQPLFAQIMIEQDPEIDQKTLEKEWQRVWQSQNLLFSVIIEKSTDNIVGFIEAKSISTDSPVIGIILFKKFRNRGYGEESMQLFQALSLKINSGISYFIYGVMESNIASVKLVNKINNSVFVERVWIAEENDYLLIYWIFV